MSAISTWRRDKYFAMIRIKTIFTKSDGWNDIPPKLNQLVAPFAVFPRSITKIKIKLENPYNENIIHGFFKNDISTFDVTNKTPSATNAHMLCFNKYPSLEPKDAMVIVLKNNNAIIDPTIHQSIVCVFKLGIDND